ncbi:protein NUCLEOLAR COMPLEX ASSOCIATED 4 isoform X2 [Cryptomeria japonica]|uniref:protein NUCLEOLAR COMPLEX ASSOCIATED 4 isoform X2 n=1 Tax=Cryptomeria japonica TaxID=3369 RepID=UPI0027DA99FD|nr:protein NUCLEOLAR COMPLEX ASSOCIATED 4 isoform X2 [Cryptomeria japonica]
MERTKKLGHELLTSRAHVNNAPILICLLSSCIGNAAISDQGLEALITLQAFFLPLLRTELAASAVKEASERLKKKRKRSQEGKTDDGEKAEDIYRKWLWSKYRELLRLLRKIVASSVPNPTLRVAAMDALMEFARQQKQGRFQTRIYLRLISSLVHSKAFDDVILTILLPKYFKYKDICYVSYSGLAELVSSSISRKYEDEDISADNEEIHISKSSSPMVIQNVYKFLSCIPPPSEDDIEESEEEMWSSVNGLLSDKDNFGGFGKQKTQQTNTDQTQNASKKASSSRISAKRMRSKMSKAWMSFLKLPLPVEVYKKVLANLHKTVVPYLSNPILLSDFLTRSYDIGGITSVMALNSLFILITQHGLEYPDFYNKLYALLEPSIFMAKYRSHFFELLDRCLKSPLLPAYLAAAFAKKLSRLALYTPPSGSLLVIALIHNLLRRHPSINCLVHWDHKEMGEVEGIETKRPEEKIDNFCQSTAKPGRDMFVIEEKDTAKSKALLSSLWEIETLRRHYCPAVSRFVTSLENDLTVRAKTTEVVVKDFSSGSYGTIFSEEVGRRIKQVPLAFYKTMPSTLFPEKATKGSSPNLDFAGWRFTPCDRNKSTS